MKNSNLTSLIIMVAVSFASMYVLMYMMVDSYGDVYANLNQFYMASMMTGAMVVIEMMVMGSMYSKKVRMIATVAGTAVLVLSIFFIRDEVAISDKEFLKSMISHHGSALLMCEKSKIEDPEIKNLCSSIISGQQEQIDWMKTKLSSLK